MLETHMKLCLTVWKIIFCLQNWENGPKMGQGFINLLKNFANSFYWICFFNEHLYYLLCSCTNQYLFLRYGPKCSQPIRTNQWIILVDTNSLKSWSKHFWVGVVRNRCGKSGHGSLKLILSQERTDRMNWCKVQIQER